MYTIHTTNNHHHHTPQAAHNLHSILMPGGLVCFRDYAHGDLAELRLAGVGKAPARRHNSPQVDASQVEGEGELTCSMPHPCSTSNFTQQQVYLEEQQTIQQPAYLEEQQSTQAGNSQCLGERLYVRQDGTMCRYFTEVLAGGVGGGCCFAQQSTVCIPHTYAPHTYHTHTTYIPHAHPTGGGCIPLS